MSNEAKLELDGKTYTLPTLVGSEGEKAVDISSLRASTGYITLDDGYGNTGSCVSNITFIDGEKGILRYRGIPIEELAEKSTFIETAYLIIYGTLPNRAQIAEVFRPAHGKPVAARGHEVSFRGFPDGRASDGDPLGDDQRGELFRRGPDALAIGQGQAVRRLCGAADFAGAHDRGVFLPQIARAAADLSEEELQIHGELPAHDVLDAV